ncbi:hypothetical protein AB0L88_20780 [Saccharopolyspora shandongensis]|uniref:hypothetical protein n=1 Tax=Saccharopolyspora shandongensis TaxID=418495 RepID=UPI00344303D3
MSGFIKPVGWSERLARRKADDERLLQEYARGEGAGRNLRPLRDWVHHVRQDIGANGVITKVELKPDGETVAWFYVEPEPEEQPAPEPETRLPNVPVVTSVDVPEMPSRSETPTRSGPRQATAVRARSLPTEAQSW